MANEVKGVIRFEIEKSSADQAADNWAKAMASKLNSTIKSLGFGGTTGFKASKETPGNLQMMSAFKGGMMGAILGTGLIKGITMIADAVLDFPLVVAVMKLLKLILMLLLMPLIPILKPLILMLAWVAKQLVALMPKTPSEEAGSITGGMAGMIIGAIFGGPFGAILGLAIGALVGDVAGMLGAFLGEVTSEIVKGAMKIITGALGMIASELSNVAGWFKYYWGYIQDVLDWAWTWMAKIWTSIYNTLKTAADSLTISLPKLATEITDVFDKIREVKGLKESGTAGKFLYKAAGVGQIIMDVFKGIAKTLNLPGFDDFIMTPHGGISTHPDDYIIGTKNPKGLGGGGGTININIDKPTLAGSADIRALVSAISQELYKTQRRYNSYVA